MKQQTYLNLIGKYLSGSLSQAEEARLMEWVRSADANQMFFDEMMQLWELSEEYETPEVQADTAKGWDALNAKITALEDGKGGASEIQEPEAKVRRLQSGRFRLLRYAAAILLLLAAGYWSYQSIWQSPSAVEMVSVMTGPEEEKEILLPDSSMVVLNERSKLAYSTDFTKREVELSGEAFFEVTKQAGKTFTITAEGTTTTVLGTSFNVRAYPEEEKVEVSVATGKVAVSKHGEQTEKVELVAGQASVYNKEADKLDKTVLLNAAAWKTGRLDFENVRLGRLANNLERYFGISITFEEEQLQECRYMGSFPNPSLQDIFDALEFTMGLEIEQRQGSYLIKGDASQCQ